MRRLLAVLMVASAMAAPGPVMGQEAVLYVSPTGTGTACSATSPCDLGYAASVAEQQLVLLYDGVYRLLLKTSNPGVTYRALNRRKAVIKPTQPPGGPGGVVLITQPGTTLDGLTINGVNTTHEAAIRIEASDVVVMNSTVKKAAEPGIRVLSVEGDINHVDILNNTITDTGLHQEGESIYVGAPLGLPWWTVHRVKNVNIVGNKLRRFTSNGVDLKHNSRRVNVYYNTMEGQFYPDPPPPGLLKPGNEGIISIKGRFHDVHDNIMRDIQDPGPSALRFSAYTDSQIRDNVIYNVLDGDGAASVKPGQPTSSEDTVVADNIFCELLPPHDLEAADGVTYSGNVFHGLSDQAICLDRAEAIETARKGWINSLNSSLEGNGDR